MKKRNAHHLALFGILSTALVISYSAAFFGVFDLWQEKWNDRLFLKREANPNIIIIEIDEISLEDIGQWPWSRETFGDIISMTQNAKTIGIDVNFSEASRIGINDDKKLKEAIEKSSIPVVLPIQIERDVVLSRPADIFSDIGILGVSNILEDPDGVTRDMLLFSEKRKSFGGVLAEHSGADISLFPDITRLGYVGPQETFFRFSASDVLNGNVPERVFEGAVVLVGATAKDLHDFVTTPFGRMAGVEYHANAIQFIQEGIVWKEMPKALSFFFLFLIVGATALSVHFFKSFYLLASAFISILLSIIVSSFILFSYHTILPFVYFLISFLLTSGGVLAFKYIYESREKNFLRNTFQFYLAPEALNELLENPDKVKLGGDKRTVTIFFSDIRGFTTMSEKLSPEELTHLMNMYLTAMTDVVMDKQGIVDKYIGDAIMAFWGAPLNNPRHAELACQTVKEMMIALEKLNEKFEKEGFPTVSIGCGLNTGEVVVGNMGSHKRFDYTIMGDEVNFASRLEGLTKPYGVKCVVSETTYRAVNFCQTPGVEQKKHPVLKQKLTESIYFRELDLVNVKGKTEPRRIYELITDNMTDTLQKAISAFEEGRSLYEKGDWKKAIVYFEKALALRTQDAPSQLFLKRTRALLENPPENWDGVYTFTEK